MALERDFQFPHRYEIEEAPELPGSGQSATPVHYFPGSATRSEHDGVWLMIRPENSDPWIGVFASGYGCSKILSLPDPDFICIVASGSAYIVKANDPRNCQELPTTSLTDVRAIPEARLVIFADFVRLTAFGQNGVAWTSPRLCWDDLEIVKVTSETIEGVGYDPGGSGNCDLPFAVELATGRPIIPPPLHLNGREFS